MVNEKLTTEKDLKNGNISSQKLKHHHLSFPVCVSLFAHNTTTVEVIFGREFIHHFVQAFISKGRWHIIIPI